ncbi:MAG: sugar ABC transporter ATP-binding protein [Rectinemataceae bacterium]|nr:sugar ABC transporter ATP-binding protein [Rectinemataceae bacterium]
MNEPLLQMNDIKKTFPGVVALNNVSFELRKGEIHALIGENGAGKSTLMKVLTGIYKQDSGEILFKGREFLAKNPKDAQDKGISMIHQEFNLVPDLTVAENIFIAREPSHFGNILIDDKRMLSESQKLIHSVGLGIDARMTVNDLSVAEKQMIEIVKALVVRSDVLVLDEPTSALTEKEVQRLFQIIRRLKEDGVGIIYISHRLEEFNEIVDRVTVLRDGCFVSSRDWNETSIPELIHMMVGRNLTEQFPYQPSKSGEVVFKAEHINRGNALKDISIQARSGEILGLAGLMGAGRTELARAIFGADRIESGILWIHGKEYKPKSPHDAIQHGISYLPEDRKKDGLFLELDVFDNMLAGNLPLFSFNGVIDEKKCKSAVERKVAELNVKTPSYKQIIKYLSGGNQQKVLVSRWFCKKFSMIIFDEPTRGIDVGAKLEIYLLMNKVKASGAAIIMISSEMPEILGMSDRIVVMCEGRVTGELSRSEATSERIMKMASNIQ